MHPHKDCLLGHLIESVGIAGDRLEVIEGQNRIEDTRTTTTLPREPKG